MPVLCASLPSPRHFSYLFESLIRQRFYSFVWFVIRWKKAAREHLIFSVISAASSGPLSLLCVHWRWYWGLLLALPGRLNPLLHRKTMPCKIFQNNSSWVAIISPLPVNLQQDTTSSTSLKEMVRLMDLKGLCLSSIVSRSFINSALFAPYLFVLKSLPIGPKKKKKKKKKE